MGISNIDPRWSGFARYLQRLIERVQLEWDGILKNSAVYPPRGSKVEIKFALDSSGRISRIIKVDSTSSDQGRTACLAALTDPMPYGAWTPEMIRLLGKEQAITFTFLYQ
ncbi:MAG TPA: hypothetical protein VHV47_01250 [Opitutaceae bacterium]|nr:hypothetical protein [Opitutaceae bacterium]